jgi:hypothetical protein
LGVAAVVPSWSSPLGLLMRDVSADELCVVEALGVSVVERRRLPVWLRVFCTELWAVGGGGR